MSRAVLGPTQFLIHQGPWSCHGGKGSGVKVIAQLYLLLRLRIKGAIISLPV